MNVNVAHLEAQIRRFHKATVVLAEKASNSQIDQMKYFPIIIGKTPNILVATSSIGEPDSDFYTPYIVNATFSLEILLKAIIYYETKVWETGHNLVKLYENISTPVKREANDSFKKLCDANKDFKEIKRHAKEILGHELKLNLTNLLLCSSRAFETWRYAFDDNSKNVCFFGYGDAFDVLWDAKEKIRPNL
ncbi:hypothetical protein [Undibacterium sp. Xuan67W]|uniref:hypothetical protein n=1 Tax=Undibacterium sp. Xuan67W TaxID=3413057 RepID=UPI003BF01ED4